MVIQIAYGKCKHSTILITDVYEIDGFIATQTCSTLVVKTVL